MRIQHPLKNCNTYQEISDIIDSYTSRISRCNDAKQVEVLKARANGLRPLLTEKYTELSIKEKQELKHQRIY